MLKLCTCIMKNELRCVKREGATVLYVKQLGNLFYSTLLNIAKEFRRVFPNSPACCSALVVWINSQLTHFISHVIKQVFVPQSSITTVSECVSCLRQQNAQVVKAQNFDILIFFFIYSILLFVYLYFFTLKVFFFLVVRIRHRLKLSSKWNAPQTHFNCTARCQR